MTDLALDSIELGGLITNTFNETFFYNLNRNAFDKVSAHLLYGDRFKNKLNQPHTLTIVIGTDSGLLPHYVMSQGIANGSRFIFIEPTHVLRQLHAHRLLPVDDPAMAIISPDNWETTIKAFKIQDYFYINAVQSFNAFCAEDDYPQCYAELSWHITEVLSQLNWNYSMALGNETFTARQINNLADNLLPARLLSQVFAGKTVAILAGGPSLDDVLPWIQQHRQQLVVFAVSRISRQLKAINLEPDFVFSVDPTELSFDISKEMLEFSDRPIFIHAYHTVPRLVNQWQGRQFYLGPRFPWQSKLNPDNFNSTGPTVTNTAISMAQHMGFKRIILAGVDLCFTRDGYTHAQGSDEHKAGPRFNLTSLQTETNGGFMAPTSCDFAAAIQTLSAQTKIIRHMGTEIINPSVNAAKIEAISYCPLTDIELSNERIDIDTIINPVVLHAQSGQADYPALITEIKRAHFQICAIKKLAEEALTINQEMYSDSGHIANYKDKRALDKIEKKLNRDHRHYSKLVKRFGIRQFIKITQPFYDTDWSAEDAKQIGQTYYDAYRKGATALEQLLNDALNRIQARQEEQKSIPDFALIIAQWRRDRSFARARRWRRNHADNALTEAQLQALNDLEQQFLSVQQNQNTKHVARAKSHASFSQLKKRAALLFKHKKSNELGDLLSGLLKHPDQTDAQPYVAMVNGYLAELKDQQDAALQAYNAVIDHPDSPLLEEALLRIAHISVARIDNDNAYLALECLAQISPVYLPFYAEINRLRGDFLAAIDSYNHYIHQFPNDRVAQMKLATLYFDTQAYQAAEMMVDFILAKDASLISAMQLKKRLKAFKTVC